MQYAIIDSENALHAILDIPQGQSTTWTGPDDFKVLISDKFDIPFDADFSDYRWNGESFDYIGSQETAKTIHNLTDEELEELVTSRIDAAVQKALEAIQNK